MRDRLLPWGTRRRYYYERGRAGITVVKSEGWRSLWLRAQPLLRSWLPWGIGDRYKSWIRLNEPGAEALQAQRRQCLAFKHRPKISVVTPVGDADERWLRLSIESVISQTYDNWELCIADGGSKKAGVRRILEEYSGEDSRVKVKFLPQDQGLAGDSNEALSLANGDFVAFLHHDDELAPFALYECVELLNASSEADFIYSDEDKIAKDGKRESPAFKPDWSPDMFLSYMYTGKLGVYRKTIVDEIGGFGDADAGAEEYDFVLRFIEKTARIHHIAKVLYHNRSLPESGVAAPGAASSAHLAGKKAIADYLARNGIKGEVLDGPASGSYRVKRDIVGRPLVSIIVPSRNNAGILKKCLDSILTKTGYDHYEILVTDNQSNDPNTLDFYRELAANPRIQILHYDRPFNYSAINNYAVSQANGEHFVLLNDDTEVITGEWLSVMLEHSQRGEVGAVGAKLLYPGGNIQHCGLILDPDSGRISRHAFYRQPDPLGHLSRANIINNYSAVTAACMMTKKRVYQEIGGLDEGLAYSYNDVDFCLKMREMGFVNVYTPYAKLHHLESYTRGYNNTSAKRLVLRKEAELMGTRWGSVIAKGDPYCDPNLSPDGSLSMHGRHEVSGSFRS